MARERLLVVRHEARDADTERRLGEAGWLLVVVWEHEDPRETAARVAALVLQRQPLKDPTSSANCGRTSSA